MHRLERVRFLINILLREMPEYRRQAEQFGQGLEEQRRLLRCLMNVRPPLPLNEDFLRKQDELLSEEREGKGVVEAEALPPCNADPRIAVWKGDITRLRADAIVNAANSALLGCFYPCHSCIDNAIHSAAGLQLREECSRIMEAQGYPEPAGQAKITNAYQLPSKYVIHTVGPVIQGEPSRKDQRLLSACYRSCLELAEEKGLKSIAFCCVSTGEYHYPNQEAAEIAVRTVKRFLEQGGSGMRVIFNVFQEKDDTIYRRLLGAASTAESGLV